MDTTILRRKDTTKGPPLRVLSLDGGGVRGYSMLILLQELMYRTYVECEGKAPRRDQIPKPCDHFDLIVGTGTGGLIALMLGRLRLDLETCKDVYVRMTRRVFETDKTFAGIPYRSTLFKASRLEDAIRQCVREHTVFESEGNDGSPQLSSAYLSSPLGRPPSASGPGVQRRLSRSSASTVGRSNPSTPVSQRSSAMINGSIWGNPNALLYDSREYRTKTAITAIYKGTPRGGSSVLLRSYDSRKEPPPEFNCRIWEAGRATSATGLAFKPIQIGQHFFLDEGAGTYNPSPEALDEAAVNEWPGREIGVFVSVGTGKRPPGTNHLQHEWWEDFFPDTLGIFADARRALISKIEGCEATHHQMMREHLAKRNVPKENYIRLNVEVGVGEFGMNEWNRLAEISTSTRRYLTKSEVQKMNLDASVKLAKIERAHRRQESHATAIAGADEEAAQQQYRPVPPVPGPPPPPPPRSSTASQQASVAPPPPLDVAELPAVELPAEDIPVSPQHFSSPHQTLPPITRVSSQDKYTIIPSDDLPEPLNVRKTSRTSNPPLPPHNISPPPARHSLDQAQLSPTSPHTSTDTFNINNQDNVPMVPPPVPPKTPIPYPDDNAIVPPPLSMPIPPRSANRPPGNNGYPVYNQNQKLPYPDDGPPPLVNKQRKPTYTPR